MHTDTSISDRASSLTGRKLHEVLTLTHHQVHQWAAALWQCKVLARAPPRDRSQETPIQKTRSSESNLLLERRLSPMLSLLLSPDRNSRAAPRPHGQQPVDNLQATPLQTYQHPLPHEAEEREDTVSRIYRTLAVPLAFTRKVDEAEKPRSPQLRL